jgi:hypothetical protein
MAETGLHSVEKMETRSHCFSNKQIVEKIESLTIVGDLVMFGMPISDAGFDSLPPPVKTRRMKNGKNENCERVHV